MVVPDSVQLCYEVVVKQRRFGPCVMGIICCALEGSCSAVLRF